MPKPKRNFKILCVYAHPADLCCEGSGTVALQAERGDDITALLLSDGERHHADVLYRETAKPKEDRNPRIINATVDELRAFKRFEAERACEILGISKLIAFGWPDVHWTLSIDNIVAIADVIFDVRPDVILTHIPKQNQIPTSDIHAVVGQLVRLATQYCNDALPQTDGHEAHHTKLTFYFPDIGMADARSMLCEGIVCDMWVDITPVVEKKIHAMDQCVSQGYHETCARKIMEAIYGRWGMLAECSYAEPWMREQPTRYSSLPVRDEDLDKAYYANDLPGDLMISRDITSAVPDDAYDFPGPLEGQVGRVTYDGVPRVIPDDEM